jgi:hypothetical protein
MIGFWGYIDPQTVKKYKTLYPKAKWVDLDVGQNAPETKILPEAYCKIIKNIFDNAFYLKERLAIILAPIGKDKCDNGFFAYSILKDYGFDIVPLKFEEVLPAEKWPKTPICTSNLPLKEKVERITNEIVMPQNALLQPCEAKFGFWGVPPHDLSILELFPAQTHVYGWLRCVEAKAPADIELEMFVEPDVPTVFYAQTFCAKNQLAKYLADKHGGIYVDVDGLATNSVRAKIEAFLKLR